MASRFRSHSLRSNKGAFEKQAAKLSIRSGAELAPAVGMAGWRDFRDIGAWQRARELKLLAKELVDRPQVQRDFKFRDQVWDAARSAPRNIAEGFARYKHKEFAQFARVAKGSEGEVLKAVNGLIRYLETTPDPPPGPKWAKKKPPLDPDAP